MERSRPPDVDTEHANAARAYDYMLGGGHNFAVDREFVDKLLTANPDARRAFQANRAFLGRAVAWCCDRGIEQFLDLGSGVPTVGNVHEIAHARNPAARVAYVDFEPVAAAHAAEILAGVDTATITKADLREPAEVLAAPGVASLLDLSRPVAVLAIAVLHFVPGDLGPVIAAYRDVLAPGSVIAISHGSADHDDPRLAARATASARQYGDSATPATQRNRAELLALFDGLDVIEPGLVDVTEWPDPDHPWPDGGPVGLYAVAARTP